MASLGLAYGALGDDPRALDWMRQALDEAALCGHTANWTGTLVTMSVLYRKQGDLGAALRLAEQGALRAAEISFWSSVAAGLGHSGYILVLQGRLDEAERRLPRAAALLERLNQRCDLCEALYFWAELLVRQQDLCRALSLAEQARAMATDVGRGEYQLAATILGIRLRLAHGQLDVAAASDELERLLPAWSQDVQQAALHYELWRLDPAREADRRAAADLYHTVHERAPRHEFRTRYHALTGERLPDPSAPPDIMAVSARQPGDMDALLARVDRVIADLGQAPDDAVSPRFVMKPDRTLYQQETTQRPLPAAPR
jgi:hypothetical protein